MEKDYNTEIGKWLANKRKEKGYSQQYIAERLNVSKVAVHYWETGKRVIYAVHFMDYCKVIGVDPKECIEEIMK